MSQLFVPTLRETPADAEAVSHKLLVRGGFIRQLTAGVWVFLPLGWRVHQKVVDVIREEMDAIGAQEMLMPLLTPWELWEQTGRVHIPEIFRLQDRHGREIILPLTHEETATWVAREISSYRQLPQLLYHFSIKERDEAGLDVSFQKHDDAYNRIFQRVGLEYAEVQAESGMMGGKESIDFLAPSGSGENVLVTCENGDYAADQEIAHGVPRDPEFGVPLEAPEAVDTPGVTTIDEVAAFLNVDSAATAKAMPVVKQDGTLVLALIRGDDRLEDAKLASALESDWRPATLEAIQEGFGADPGSIGPVGFDGEIIADETLREGQFVAGANETGRHLRGVQAGRDYRARFEDLRRPLEGDRCPSDGGALHFQTAIEVGHIFKFGSRYSEPLDATFLDEDGQEKPLVGGSYGIGPGRVMAAIVEQKHDENGIIWPAAVAPYDVHIVALPGLEERALEAAQVLSDAGRDVLVDDREQRAGEKFADADLIGIPVRITVGKKTLDDGGVDVRDRASGEERRVSVAELRSAV